MQRILKVFDEIELGISKSSFRTALIMVFCTAMTNFYRAHLAFFPTVIKFFCRTSVFVFIFLFYLHRIIKYKHIDIIAIICAFFSIYIVIITVINNGDIITALYSYTIIAMANLLVSNIFFEYNRKLYIKTSAIYYTVFSVICFINYFIGIDGHINSISEIQSSNTFYGNRCDILLYLIPNIFFVVLYFVENRYIKFPIFVNIKNGKLSKYLLFILFNIFILISGIFSKGATNIIVVIILLIYILFFLKNANNKLFNIYVYTLLIVILFISFNLLGKYNPALIFVARLFGKDATASGRIEIYEHVLNHIKDINIFIGIGLPRNRLIFPVEYLNGTIVEYYSAHCIQLDVLYKYGLIGILFMVLFCIIICLNNKYTKNILTKNLSSIVYFVFLIWATTNVCFYYQVLYFLGLITYSGNKFEYDILDNKFILN